MFLKITQVFAILLTRLNSELYIHPIFYFCCYFIAVKNTYQTVVLEASQVNIVVKWLDISTFIDYILLLQFFTILALCTILFVIWQFYVSFNSKNMAMNLIQRYSIKIFGIIIFLLNTIFILPLLRSCISIINSNSNIFFIYQAWIMIICQGLIIIPFYSLFLVNIAPYSSNIDSSLSYFNYMRAVPIMRFILCIAHVIGKSTHIAFIEFSLIPSLFLIFKDPILYYIFDRAQRLLMYGMIWIMFVRTVGTLQNFPIPAATVYSCLPVFVVSMFWFCQIRVSRIILAQKVTVKQIKIINYMVQNLILNLNSLILYLLEHKKKCQKVTCQCHNMNNASIGTIKGQSLWYKLVVSIIQQNYETKQYEKLLTSEQNLLLQKLTDLIIVAADVMSKKLLKWNTALYRIQEILNYIEDKGWHSLHFRSYYHTFIKQMEYNFEYNCQQEDVLNPYAQKYYQFQRQLCELRQQMRKSAKKHMELWNQVSHQQPNSDKIINLIKQTYKNNLKVENYIEFILENKREVQRLISPLIINYFQMVCNSPKNIIQPLAQEKEKISQNMKRFAYDSKTGVCVISINNNKEFGNLILANKEFERITGFDLNMKLNVDNFIADAFIEEHRQLMQSFIKDNKYALPYRKVYIKNSQQYLHAAGIYIQVIPSLEQGFQVCVFLFGLPSESIFIWNQKESIIGYSYEFEEQIVSLINKNDVIEIFPLKFMKEIAQEKVKQFLTNQNAFNVTLEYSKVNKETESSFYFCKVESKQNQANSFLSLPIAFEDRQDSKQKLLMKKEQYFHKQNQSAKSIKDRQSLQQIFSIIQKDSQCSNIRKLTVFAIIVFLIIASLIIGIIFVSINKNLLIAVAWKDTQKHHLFIDKVVDSLYFLRKANIQAYVGGNESLFQYYRHSFDVLNREAVELNTVLAISSQKMIEYFSVLPNTSIVSSQMKFFVSLQQNIFVPLTNLAIANMSNLNFSISQKQIKVPYDNFKYNFIKASLNSIHSIFPLFDQIIHLSLIQNQCKLGKNCIQNNYEAIIGIIGICLTIVLLITLNCVAYHIKTIKENTYELMICLPQDEVQNREASIKDYVLNNFPDLIQIDQKLYQIQDQQFKMHNQDHFKYHSRKLSQQSVINGFGKNEDNIYQPKSNQFHQETQRQLQFQKKDKKRNLNFSKIKFQKDSNFRICFKYLCLVTPLLLYFIFVSFYASFYTYSMLQQSQRQSFLCDRARMLKQIKYYLLQLGLDNGSVSIPNFSIASFLDKNFDELYSIERDILKNFIENPMDSYVSQTVKRYNQENICDKLGALNKNNSLRINFTKESCQNVEGYAYLTKGMRSAVVTYIQTARTLWQNYQNCLNCTQKERISFSISRQQILIQKLDYYFFPIIKYEYELFKQFSQQRRTIFIAIIQSSSIFMLLIVVLTIVYFLKNFRTKLLSEIEQIRSIFYIVSTQTIRRKPNLTEMVLQKVKYDFLS